jgi:hypothetical protein
VHRAPLKREIARILREKGFDQRSPEETAEAYITAAAGRSGILEERGPDLFAFWHPTFSEYLSAVALASSTEGAIESLIQVRDDPRWREVILLTVGHIAVVQRDEQAAVVVLHALINSELNPTELLLHGGLRLVAACIADGAGIDPGFSMRIVAELADVVAAEPYAPFVESLSELVTSLRRLAPNPLIIRSLDNLLEQREPEIRVEVARMLAEMAPYHDLAFDRCVRLLYDGDSRVRGFAAWGLACAAHYSQDVWVELRALEWYQAPLRWHVYGGNLDGWDVLRFLTGAGEDGADILGLLPRSGAFPFGLVERITAVVEAPEPFTIQACRKVFDGQALTADDARQLAALVTVRGTDSVWQRKAREWLFRWIWANYGMTRSPN